MAITGDKFTIMLPPKTGSTWLRQALNNAGVDWHNDGAEHGTPESALCDREQGLLVRGPVPWLRSYYCFRFEAPVRLYPELDEIIDSQVEIDGVKKPTKESFAAFVHDVLTLHPGFVSQMYWSYAEHYGGTIYVIQTEMLPISLSATLTSMGVDFDFKSLDATPVINDSKTAADLRISSSVMDMICDAEPMEILPDNSSYQLFRRERLGL